MGVDGFVSPMIEMTNEFYALGMDQLNWQKEIQGTKCIVTRVSDKSKYKKVHGSTVSSTLALDSEVFEFDYVIIINMNDMVKIFQKSINSFDIYDNVDKLRLGDVIRFTSQGQLFRFKVTDIQVFGNNANIINRYTLSGLAEVNSEKMTYEDMAEDYPKDECDNDGDIF